jgi:hypothetical protein
MKHSIDELLEIAHRYYPRNVLSYDASYPGTAELLRLNAARRAAGATDEAWRAMLRRLAQHFPDARIQNRSLHLPTGNWDACYSGAIHFPGDRWLGFLVSFIAPYYIAYSARMTDDPEATTARQALADKMASQPAPDTVDVYMGNMMTVMHRDAITPEIMAALEDQERRYQKVFTGESPFAPDWKRDEKQTCQRQTIRFDFSPDEEPYAAWLAREIKVTFGCDRMPPEVGNIVVPDISIVGRAAGEATLYDCLFSDIW